jgi:alkanesulfonate monooxygenase SsuD/methylene tetrahydromethanopterin reductase-like flavin-dependent oxidoreductase (luciferase family)
MDPPEFFLYLPQISMEIEQITARAVAAERAGFRGIAFMDHLAPPLSEASPMFEAMTVATWVAARTTDLMVSHLVLCDALRHPAVLARQAVTLDHATGGRFELGLGWGSMGGELAGYGITRNGPRERAERLGESLDLITALWSGAPVAHEGRYFELACPGQQPTPRSRIPIVIGGAGRRTLELVRRHADWWNVPIYALDRLAELRTQAGKARASSQHLVGWIAATAERDEVERLARRRYGLMTGGPVIGDAAELIEHFERYRALGVERFYVWFTDFAPPSSLRSFGEEVIDRMPR